MRGLFRFYESIRQSFVADAAEGKRKMKRVKVDSEEGICRWQDVTHSDMVNVICQSNMCSTDELLSLTFDHAATGVFDDAEVLDDPETSFVYRTGIEYTFSSPAFAQKCDSWDVAGELRNIDTYWAEASDGEVSQFIIPAERRCDFKLICGNGVWNWLKDSNALMAFCLPDILPTKQDMRNAVFSSLATAGVTSRVLTDDEIEDYIRLTLEGAYLDTPITRSNALASTRAGDWSDCVIKDALPVQFEISQRAVMLRSKASAAVLQGMNVEHMKFIDWTLLDKARAMSIPGVVIDGFPSGYQRVIGHNNQDVATFEAIVNSHDMNKKRALESYYFPTKGHDAVHMSYATFFITATNEFLRHDAALTSQQTSIVMAVLAICFGVDHPGFNNPCHIKATGPPGLGKSYCQKAVQELVNVGKCFKCNSESKMASTFPGFPEQLLMLVDEDESATSIAGTTGQLQSEMVDGTITRARAFAEDNVTKISIQPCRRFRFTSANHNYKHNHAMRSRFISVQVTRKENSKKATIFRPKSNMYTLGCLAMRTLTGRTSAAWLAVMFGLVEEADTKPFEVFCAIHAAIFPDSVLKLSPRMKQMVLTMAKFKSLEMMISYYERRVAAPLKSLFCLDFVQFLRANWIIDPYSICFSVQAQLKGIDPNATSKVLALLKNHLAWDPQGRVKFTEDHEYWITDLATSSPFLEAAADKIGLGLALMEQYLENAMTKDGTQKPAVCLHSSGRKEFYCLAPESVATMRTLTAVEESIVEHLLANREDAYFSANMDSMVFKRSVKNAIVKPEFRPPLLKNVPETQINFALHNLAACGIYFYGADPVLQTPRDAQIAVLQVPNFPGSEQVVPGSFADPDFSGEKWYSKGPKMPGIVEWMGDSLQTYLAIRSNKDPVLEKEKQGQAEAIDYYMACMDGEPDELIYTGLFDNGDTEFHEVVERPDPLMIENIDYKPTTRRLSTGSTDSDTDVYFARDQKKVDITQYKNLMCLATEYRLKKMFYGQDEVPLVYKRDGSGLLR